ncbi:MAG: hypothetical protein NUW02_00670 [Candidatus Campbellbacteria bacterium]|nr:hypothetical protein [Candidatus Campbellbacteria bacterium]
MKKELLVISTWEQFEECWQRVSTEAEAIGLLYACGSLWNDPPIEGDEEGRQLFKDKARFLLNVFREVGEEGRVADTARRVIASDEVLGKTYLLSRDEKEEGSAILRNDLISFFGVVHECLLRPPYPSRIQQFLCKEFHTWREAISMLLVGPRTNGRPWHFHYQESGPLVRALALWGSADMLTFTGGTRLPSEKEKSRKISERDQASQILHYLEFVSDELFGKYKEQWLINSLAVGALLGGGKHKTPRDLRDEEERRHRNRLIAQSLLWCRIASAKGRQSWSK